MDIDQVDSEAGKQVFLLDVRAFALSFGVGNQAEGTYTSIYFERIGAHHIIV
jgi:hypothetical protein